jgi:hypothetical protein
MFPTAYSQVMIHHIVYFQCKEVLEGGTETHLADFH